MSFPPEMPWVEIEWVDSNMASGWHRTEDMRATVTSGAMACRSLGYLFHEDEDRVVLVGSQNDNDQVADAIAIPKVAILDFKRLSPQEVGR